MKLLVTHNLQKAKNGQKAQNTARTSQINYYINNITKPDIYAHH